MQLVFSPELLRITFYNNIMALEFVGYLGGFLIAVALAPQLAKTWKTKSAKDIALLWTTISLAGLILYGIYAAINNVMPLLTFAVIESIMVIILIILKIKYDRARK
jgi:MtN3 and saliva related transmembrane protein